MHKDNAQAIPGTLRGLTPAAGWVETWSLRWGAGETTGVKEGKTTA